MNFRGLMDALPLAALLGLAATGCALADPPAFENAPMHYGIYVCSDVRKIDYSMYMKFDGAYVLNFKNGESTYWVKPAPGRYTSPVAGYNVGRFRVIINEVALEALNLTIEWRDDQGNGDYEQNYTCMKDHQYSESQLRESGISIW